MNLYFFSLERCQRDVNYQDLKEEKWDSYNCTVQFGSQGVWPIFSEGSDINSVDLAPKSQVLVTGDDYSMLKLFRYPADQIDSAYLSFNGHSSNVVRQTRHV